MNDQTIFRRAKDRDNPFVMIDKNVFENPDLSWKAKGLMGYLLSRPDDWIVRMGDLANRSPGGMSSVKTVVKELVKHGYLVRDCEQDERGRFRWSVEVHEVPVECPSAVCPSVDTLSTDRPLAENQPSTNTDLTETEYTEKDAELFPAGDLPEEPATAEKSIKEFKDYLSMSAEVHRRTGGKPSSTIPAAAGGADPYLNGPLTEACAILRITPDVLDPKEQRDYAGAIRKIVAGVQGGTPDLFVQACKVWSKHGPAWKGKESAPYPDVFGKGFAKDMSNLMRQILSGTITGGANGWSKAMS